MEREDVQALAARCEALDAKREATRRERDFVKEQLDQARGLAPSRPSPARPRRRRVALPIAVATACLAGLAFVLLHPIALSTPPRIATTTIVRAGETHAEPAPLTCTEYQAKFDAAFARDREVYASALAAKHLTGVDLQYVKLATATSPELVDKKLGRHLKEGSTIWVGRARVVVDAIVNTTYSTYMGMMFHVDPHGGVWHVIERPRIGPTTMVDVDGCSGHCLPESRKVHDEHAHRPVEFTRGGWLLQPGQTYRGDIEIAYDDVPELTAHPVWRGCSPRS